MARLKAIDTPGTNCKRNKEITLGASWIEPGRQFLAGFLVGCTFGYVEGGPLGDANFGGN